MGAGSPTAIVVIAVNTRVLLHFFPLSLPFALSFCTLFFLQGDKNEKETNFKKGLLYSYLPQMHMLSYGVTFSVTTLTSCTTLLQHHVYASILQQCLITLWCYNNIKLLCCNSTWFLITFNHLTTPFFLWLHWSFDYNNVPRILQTTMVRFEWR